MHNARKRRSANLQHVFHDCQKDRPSLVDALITSRQAVIAEVRSQDFSIVFEDPIDFRPALPLVCEGLGLGCATHILVATCKMKLLSCLDSNM